MVIINADHLITDDDLEVGGSQHWTAEYWKKHNLRN